MLQKISFLKNFLQFSTEFWIKLAEDVPWDQIETFDFLYIPQLQNSLNSIFISEIFYCYRQILQLFHP